MSRLCCILDADENFAVRISACFNSRHVLPFMVQAFSDIEAYIGCAQLNQVELLIVDESMYEEARGIPAGQIIRLCEQPMLMEGGADVCIVKFQSSDNIIRDVLSVYRGQLIPLPAAGVKDKAKLVSVYSPNGYCGKTTLALSLAHIKGRDRKVLYLNFEEFSALCGRGEKGNLSDALYYYGIATRGSAKLMSVVSRGNGYDYIAPAACAEDIADSDTDTIAAFVEELIRQGGYELVVIDVGSLVKEPWKLLEQADMILMPMPDSAHRKCRQKEFEKFMYTSGREAVMERVRMVDIVQDDTLFKDGQVNYACLAGSRYAKAVSAIDI